ncbi:MAG: hypothetical protein V4616_05470 [Bacteroidota bacterium]
MRSLRTLIIIFFITASAVAYGQQYLVLERIGSPKRIKFAAGEQIRFKVNNNDTIYQDQITMVCDTAVAFGNKLVLFRDIDKIWLGKENFWLSRLRAISLVGGTAFFTLDTFNRLVNRDSPVVTKTGLIVLGSGVGLAGILTLAKKNWFRVNSRHQLRYLDLTIG